MGKEIFEREFGRIRRVFDFVAARHRLDPTEREDFESYVTFKLIEDDYRRIRQFRGESRLETYLNVVVQRLFLDFRAERWGKWRPSARARALGKPAMIVERLLYRDRLFQNEILQTLGQHGVRLEPDALDELVQAIPCRARRHEAGGESLEALSAPSDRGDLTDGERSIASERVEAALRTALRGLTAEDRVILKMRFLDGCAVGEIAMALGLSERPLYPRLQRLFRRLRENLEMQGVGREEASAVWRERLEVDMEPALS